MNGRSTLWQVLKALLSIAAAVLGAILLVYGFIFVQLYSAFGNLSGPPSGPKAYTCGTSEEDWTIQVTPGWINPGQAVTIRFTITNSGTGSFVREKLDGPVMDLVVPTDYYDENPRADALPPTSVRWSDTQAPDRIPHRLELKPGASRSIELTYIAKVYQGQETAEGRIWHRTEYDKCIGFVIVGSVFH